MNELDPTTLKYDQWVYWLFNYKIYQGRFHSLDGLDVWLYIGLCGTRVAYPIKDVRLFNEYPSDTHFGMRKTDNGYVDERAK